MRDIVQSLGHWFQDVGRWWSAMVVGILLGAIGLVAAFRQFDHDLPWLFVGALVVALAGSFVAYHRERQLRLKLSVQRIEIRPPVVECRTCRLFSTRSLLSDKSSLS